MGCVVNALLLIHSTRSSFITYNSPYFNHLCKN